MHRLGPQKEASARGHVLQLRLQMKSEWRILLARSDSGHHRERILEALPRIDRSQRLDDGALAAPILADEDRHSCRDIDALVGDDLRYRRNGIRPLIGQRRAATAGKPL